MAQVPYKAAPTVEPHERPPDDYFRLDANPERFAAAAKGLQQLGQGIEQGAETWAEMRKDALLNNALKEADAATEEYGKLRGSEAVGAEQSYRDRVNQIFESYSSQNPGKWRTEFDNVARRYQYGVLNGKISTHAITQGQQVTSETNKTTMEVAGDFVSKNYNDPNAVNDAIHRARDAAVKQVEAEGNGSVASIRQEAIKRADNYIYSRIANAKYESNAPDGYQYAKDHLDPDNPLIEKFKVRAETQRDDLRASTANKATELFQKDPVLGWGFVQANKAALGDDQYNTFAKMMGHPEAIEGAGKPPVPGAATSNVTPIRPESAVDLSKRLRDEQANKPAASTPTQAAPGAQRGGPGVRINVPFSPLMLTDQGKDQLIKEGLKTWLPGTILVGPDGKELPPIPAAGTTFNYNGRSYTVPGTKAEPPAQAKPSAPTPAAAAPTPAATPTAAPTLPQKQSQNFTPAEKTGQALPFGEEQTKNYSPAQTAIAKAIDSRTPKDLNVRQLPGNVLERARDIALHSGPGDLKHFMAENGYPKSGAWCGEFAAAVVRSAGGIPPKNAETASSWRGWGQPTANPVPGDIAVKRGPLRADGTGSHVTFVENYNPKTGTFTGIGGNQWHARATFNIADFQFRSGMPEREARQ